MQTHRRLIPICMKLKVKPLKGYLTALTSELHGQTGVVQKMFCQSHCTIYNPRLKTSSIENDEPKNMANTH
ncbi:hypothetical protein CEP54_003085 [Fusarium duplospermum]|uniref:Uncharacterized protein n=1 Tax=Fusarium duplospermum TaxID=1325734 RepID=A0A428QR47_9HYPO|nr:hypothetical protein CEP54_003085 [Fusarium duplospermum]